MHGNQFISLKIEILISISAADVSDLYKIMIYHKQKLLREKFSEFSRIFNKQLFPTS